MLPIEIIFITDVTDRCRRIPLLVVEVVCTNTFISGEISEIELRDVVLLDVFRHTVDNSLSDSKYSSLGSMLDSQPQRYK